MNVELETVCGITSDLPQHEILEVAFWGRSNVGKSSLLNCVWGRKNLARTSGEPGKTQTINYYRATLPVDKTSGQDSLEATGEANENAPGEENRDIYMVDLPGYGYAKTSRETAKKWMTMIRRYLETSQALRVVFLLIDSRHEPTDKDIEQFRLLYSLGFNPLIVATKVDKLKKNEKAKNLARIRRILTAEAGANVDKDNELPVIGFSATSGEGKSDILEYLDYFVKVL